MNIANAVRESASAHIRNVMDIDAVNIVESANMPSEKSSPSYFKWTVIDTIRVSAGDETSIFFFSEE